MVRKMCNEELRYRLEWHAGPGAQVEVFSPGEPAGSLYKVRYIPPLHLAIRPPMVDRPLGPTELNPINDELDRFVAAHSGPNGRAPAGQGAGSGTDAFGLEDIGGLLHDLILPRYVQGDLRPRGVFLEFGVDKGLLGYPWELMHDGIDFLCMRHDFGRFINGSEGVPFDAQPGGFRGTEPETIWVLLIAVSRPETRKNRESYDPLLHVDKEAENIAETLTDIPGVKVDCLFGERASYNRVVTTLRSKCYQIIHYCGHAHTDARQPLNSSLVLHNKDLTTGTVQASFGKNQPILCFINACESATNLPGRDQFDVYGLARAFLETGAYLIGSRWKVKDKGASVFAPLFYAALLREGKPLGAAVRAAPPGVPEVSTRGL